MLPLLAAAALVTGSAALPTLAVRPEFDIGAVVVMGVENLGAYYLQRTDHYNPCPCPVSWVPGFDRISLGRSDPTGSLVSDYLLYGSIVAAPVAVYLTDPGSSRDQLVAGLVSVEAMSLAGSTANLLKEVVHRPRPPSYGSGATPPFDYQSFPSGHATATFSAAASLVTLYAMRHPHARATPWIAAAGFAVATTTGLLRIESGHHFPSDVVTGAAIGTVAGVLVPIIHEDAPTLRIGPQGVSFTLRFGSVR